MAGTPSLDDAWDSVGQREARRVVMKALGVALEILVTEEYRMEPGAGVAIGEYIEHKLAQHFAAAGGGS
jgi:hypothetical protein